MEVKLLEAFRVVIDQQSVTGAARILGLTQPAVSAQVARLEAQVGFELFERVGGRLKLTERGRQFDGEVRTVLSSIRRLDEIAASIRTGDTERLTVASHPSASIALMPRVVARLRRRRPQARLHMINRTSENVCAIFDAGGADVGIAEWPIHLQGVELIRYHLPCVAILPPGHLLAAQPRLAIEDIAREPFVAMSERRLIGHRVTSLFEERGLPWAPVVESEYFSTICSLVATGCGVSIVDRLSAEHFAPLGVTIRELEPAVPYEIGVFRRDADAPTPLSDELVGLIGSVLGEVTADAPEETARTRRAQ